MSVSRRQELVLHERVEMMTADKEGWSINQLLLYNTIYIRVEITRVDQEGWSRVRLNYYISHAPPNLDYSLVSTFMFCPN